MRTTPSRTNSGIALIIVLIVVVVLGILAGGFAYTMKVETTLARHATFSTDLDWAGRAGVEVAKWILAQSTAGPNGQFDSLKQVEEVAVSFSGEFGNSVALRSVAHVRDAVPRVGATRPLNAAPREQRAMTP